MAARKSAAPQEGEGRKPFLDLDAEVDDINTVTLDGQTYELAAQADLSIADQENMSRFFIQLGEIRGWQADAGGWLTPEQEEALDNLEVRVCCIALPGAPADAFAGRKNKRRRTRLIEGFTAAVDMTPFLDRMIQHLRPQVMAAIQLARETQAKAAQSGPRLVRGNDSDTTVSATPNSSSTLPSEAEAA